MADPERTPLSGGPPRAPPPPFNASLLFKFLGQLFASQLKLLVPIFAILSLFMLLVLHTPLKNAQQCLLGFFAVAVGLTLFLTALRG